MKEGWKYVSLDNVCKVQNGFAFDSKLFGINGVPLIRIRDIKRGFSETYTTEQADSSYYVENGDILIGMDGDFNIAEWKGGHALLNQRVCRLVPTTNLHPRFAMYFLPKALDEINSKTAFSTVKHLSSKQVSKILIPLPPLSEQQRIVTFLDTEFAKIDALKVKAEQSLQNAKDLFQAALKEEMTPKEGWEEKTLGQTCQLKSGNSSANNSSIGSLPFVKVGDLNLAENIEGIVTSSRFVNREENIKAIFPIGTTIFPKRGGAILTNKKRLSKVEICCDLNIMGVIPGCDLTPKYLYYYFLNTDLKELYDGASIPQINNCNIAPLAIHYPSKATQYSIVDRLDALCSLLSELEQKYTKIAVDCDALKQAILRETFE